MPSDAPTARQLAHHEVSNERRVHPIRVVAHDIVLGENIGSLFRLCDAFGVERLHLAGSSLVPPHPKIRKVARDTDRAVPYQHDKETTQVLGELRQDGWMVCGVEITSTSEDIRHLSSLNAPRVCLVLGAERHGLPEPVLEVCDKTYFVPMFGQNSSLNVATAAAIALFEASRRFFDPPPNQVPPTT